MRTSTFMVGFPYIYIIYTHIYGLYDSICPLQGNQHPWDDRHPRFTSWCSVCNGYRCSQVSKVGTQGELQLYPWETMESSGIFREQLLFFVILYYFI